jgi:hypothetical protein
MTNYAVLLLRKSNEGLTINRETGKTTSNFPVSSHNLIGRLRLEVCCANQTIKVGVSTGAIDENT